MALVGGGQPVFEAVEVLAVLDVGAGKLSGALEPRIRRGERRYLSPGNEIQAALSRV